MEEIITNLSINLGCSYHFAEVALACGYAFFVFLCFLFALGLLSSISYLISHFLLDKYYLYLFENGQAYLSSAFDTKFCRRRIEKKYNLKIVQSYSSRHKDLIFIKFSRVEILNFMRFKDYGGSENGSF